MTTKSTGPRSTNNHWWGHVTDIMEQYNNRYKTHLSKWATARLLMIEMAEMDEWPGETVETHGGTRIFEPMAWSQVDSALQNKAVDFCHAYADTEGYRLREYAEDGSVEWVTYGVAKP